MRILIALTLCVVLLVPVSLAQSPKSADESRASLKSEAGLKPALSKVRPRTSSSPQASSSPQVSSSYWEYWTDVTIQAGGYINLDSDLDYSSSDTVRMTLRSSSGDLSKAVFAAYWSVPQLQYYSGADVVSGRDFSYTNAGGATLNTYGNQFRLQVINNGTTSITLSQVLLFTRVM